MYLKKGLKNIRKILKLIIFYILLLNLHEERNKKPFSNNSIQ